MKKEVQVANVENFDFIYDSLREDLEEQGVLNRFRYTKEEFKELIFGIKPIATFLILFIDKQPVGFANYSIDYRNFTANFLPNLYLNDLYVQKSFRRMGGATLLLNELKEIARQEQCGRIELIVLADNKNAIELYEKKFKSEIISNKLHYMRLEL